MIYQLYTLKDLSIKGSGLTKSSLARTVELQRALGPINIFQKISHSGPKFRRIIPEHRLRYSMINIRDDRNILPCLA